MPVIAHVFPSFSERHPKFERYDEISHESIALFKEKAVPGLLADMLIEFWQEYGVGRFSDGLLYVCDPIQKKSTLDFFFPGQDFYPVVISSFGDIFFTDFKQVYSLTPVYGWFTRKSPNFELLFEISFWREEFLKDVLNQDFHQKCIQKLGNLERDEIFGFEPAIALGGSDENIDFVKRFQMDAHLAFLAQLVEIEER
jgi:hypothetical protein